MSAAELGPLGAYIHAYLLPATPYLAAGALLLAFITFVLVLLQRRRLSKLTMGRGGSIEEALAVLGRDMKEVHAFRTELEKYLQLAETRLRSSVQGVGVVRFNPFSSEATGGNQSFAAAFLDERGSGVVLSTLYARDRVGVYAKPLEAGVSSFELTDEERRAIEKAREQIAHSKQHKK